MMDKNMHNRMLARGIAESMLRAGDKLPARPVCQLTLWSVAIVVVGIALLTGITLYTVVGVSA